MKNHFGSAFCHEAGCENLATVTHYCRAHYIKNWRLIKTKQQILKEGKFERYLRELFSRYPPSVMMVVRADLANDEAFERVREDLGLHEDINELLGDETADPSSAD
jgi:hypothetical protein